MTIRTQKDKWGKYGRYLVEIWQGGESINDTLVQEGLVAYKIKTIRVGKSTRRRCLALTHKTQIT